MDWPLRVRVGLFTRSAWGRTSRACPPCTAGGWQSSLCILQHLDDVASGHLGSLEGDPLAKVATRGRACQHQSRHEGSSAQSDQLPLGGRLTLGLTSYFTSVEFAHKV